MPLAGLIDTNLVGSFRLPRAVHDFDINQGTDIFVELAHKEVQIKQEVELPTFFNKRITNYVSQFDCIHVACCGKITDVCELNR